MKLLVLLPIAALFAFLAFRKANLLVWTIAVWLGFYAGLRWGFSVPIPASVISIYMGVATLALVAYVTSDGDRWRSFSGPLVALMTERRHRVALAAVMLALPAIVAANVWVQHSAAVEAPFFSRTIHPAPPAEVTVHEKTIDLVNVENPFRRLEREDPDAFRLRLEGGRRTYYRNCVFCHGDDMAGDGMFVHGLNPIPTNFQDSGTIAMLQESFLFWRISKGGPGLPEEGAPWDSAMPAWEKFLTEEEIWEVVLYLYDFTGQKPRARDHEVHE